jgi:hypothetical protein
MKRTKDHELSSSEDGQAVRALAEEAEAQLCNTHPTQSLSLFCFKCDLRLCPACLAPAHDGHEVKGIEEVAEGCREMLRTGLTELK